VAAPRRRGAGDDSAGSSRRGVGEDSVAASRRDDAGGHGADASRWRAADLLTSEPHADSRARRRRDADSTADRPVNGHAGASHDANGVGPRWRAADLLVDGAAAAEDHVPAEPPAPPRRGRNRAHDRDSSTTSTWQAAELLDAPADHAEPTRWRAADSESGGSGHTGAKWLAADLLDQRHQSDDGDSGRRHAPAPTHADAALPSRVPPTQWAWPKEPEADPLPPRRAESAGPSAWAAADLLDEGRHTGGRRRTRETTRHGKPDDEDAGRHYRP